MNELDPTQNPQEVLNMLPYDHAALVEKLKRSGDFVSNFKVDCEASLVAEKHRVVCVEAVTGVAVQHSLELQEKQRGIYTELADADDCYVALLDTKQAIETDEAEKQGQLALEQEQQEKLNVSAKELQSRIKESVVDDSRGNYLSSLHEGRERLGSQLFYSGVKISQLQAEIDGIRSDELPALEARIAKELEHIMKLYAAVLSVTGQIGNLPAPADDPRNRILYQNSSGSSYVKPIVDSVTLVAKAELTTSEIQAERHRKLGASAVVQSVVEGGRLKRIIVSLRQSSVNA